MAASRNVFASVVMTLLSIVPPKSGCGCAITARARAPSGTEAAISMRPAAPSISVRAAGAAILDAQSRDDAPVHQVLVDDLVDVGLVDVRVPDLLGVHDHDGAFVAAIEAARLVDAHLALAAELELLDAALRIGLHFLGA